MGLGIPFFLKFRGVTADHMSAELHKQQLVIDCNQESFALTDSTEICNFLKKKKLLVFKEQQYH